MLESGERKQQVLQPVKKGNFNNQNNSKVHPRGCSVMITFITIKYAFECTL